MQISVMGAGWLGLPLAQALAADGQQVRISKRQIPPSLAGGMRPYAFDLFCPDWASLPALANCQVCILNIPAGRKRDDMAAYQLAMSRLIHRLAEHGDVLPRLF